MSKITKQLSRFNIALINNDITLRTFDLLQSYRLSHGLSLPDSIIAATALIANLELFTFNTKDFRFISHLKLIQFKGIKKYVNLNLPLFKTRSFSFYTFVTMKRFLLIFLFCFLFCTFASTTKAQCSVCTRTAQQLGEKPAKGLNAGILYLAFTPLAIVGFVGYKWWKKNK